MMENINTGNKYYVYAHKRLDNEEIFYIGKGCRDRITQRCNRNKYWHEIVNTYGYTYEKLEENLDDSTGDELEMFLISIIGKENLTNMTDGGKGSKGCYPSKETREKLSLSSSARVCTSETRNKLSESKKGFKHTPEAIEKIRQANIGFKHSLKTLKKMSEARKGVPKSEEHRKALSINSGRARKIICIELNKVFNSSVEASIFLGDKKKRKGINDAVLGRQKTAYGYKWEHYKD